MEGKDNRTTLELEKRVCVVLAGQKLEVDTDREDPKQRGGIWNLRVRFPGVITKMAMGGVAPPCLDWEEGFQSLCAQKGGSEGERRGVFSIACCISVFFSPLSTCNQTL